MMLVLMSSYNVRGSVKNSTSLDVHAMGVYMGSVCTATWSQPGQLLDCRNNFDFEPKNELHSV